MRNQRKRGTPADDGLTQWATLLADAVRREPAHPDALTADQLTAMMGCSRCTAVRTARRMVAEGKLRELRDWRTTGGKTLLAIVYEPAAPGKKAHAPSAR